MFRIKKHKTSKVVHFMQIIFKYCLLMGRNVNFGRRWPKMERLKQKFIEHPLYYASIKSKMFHIVNLFHSFQFVLFFLIFKIVLKSRDWNGMHCYRFAINNRSKQVTIYLLVTNSKSARTAYTLFCCHHFKIEHLKCGAKLLAFFTRTCYGIWHSIVK